MRTVERFKGKAWLDGDMDIEYTHTIERADGTSEARRSANSGLAANSAYSESVRRVFRVYGTYDANGQQVQREYPVGANLIVTTGRANRRNVRGVYRTLKASGTG